MIRALTFTSAYLDAASDFDSDRAPEDRAFFASQKTVIESALKNLLAADQAFQEQRRESARLQARVLLGDEVLDRGVRSTKTRMRVELKTKQAEGPDFVFGPNVDEIVDAEMRLEPSLVLRALDRFDQIADFPDKASLKKNLEDRALQQQKALDDRDAGDMKEAQLWSVLVRAVADGSDALYSLEKELLKRFRRERQYVRRFFLDTAPSRRSKPEPEPEPPV
jgi:hypothetical protein